MASIQTWKGHVLSAASPSPSRPRDSQSIHKTATSHDSQSRMQSIFSRQSIHKAVNTHKAVNPQGKQYTQDSHFARKSIHTAVNARARSFCGAVPGIAIPAKGPATRQSLHKAFSPQDSQYPRDSHFTSTRQSISTRQSVHKAVNS